MIKKLNLTVIILIAFVPIINLIYAKYKMYPLYKDFTVYTLYLIGVICSIFILFLYYKYKKRILSEFFFKDIYLNYLFLAGTLLYVWSILSTFFSDNLYVSLYGSFNCSEGFIIYTIYYLIFIVLFTINSKTSILICLEGIALVGTIISILHFFDFRDLLIYFFYRNDSLVFQNINHYGYYSLIVLLVVVYLFIITKNVKYYPLRIIQLSLCTNGLMESRSSGPIYSVVICIVILNFIVFIREYKSIRKVILVDLTIIVIMLFINTSIISLSDDLVKVSNDFNSVYSNGLVQATDSIGSQRGELWRHTLIRISERPIFGYGPDNLDLPFLGEIKNMRPHNTFLQIAASLGIPALIFYLILLYQHLIVFIRNFKVSSFEDYGLYMVVLGYLISSFFGNTEVYTTPYYIIILVFSYTLIHKRYI